MWSWLCWWRPPALLRRVIVTLKSDQDAAIQGLLWQSRGAWLVIKEPTALRPGVAPASMDGEVHIHRSNVAFLQVTP